MIAAAGGAASIHLSLGRSRRLANGGASLILRQRLSRQGEDRMSQDAMSMDKSTQNFHRPVGREKYRDG